MRILSPGRRPGEWPCAAAHGQLAWETGDDDGDWDLNDTDRMEDAYTGRCAADYELCWPPKRGRELPGPCWGYTQDTEARV